MKTSSDIQTYPKLHIAVSSVSFSKNFSLREELIVKFPNSTFNESGNQLSENELIRFLKNKDGAIVGTESVTDKVLGQTPRLKIISKYGVGLDNIDQQSLKIRNIELKWSEGINRRSVSELTLCFMLGLCRKAFQSGNKLKESQWEKNGGYQLTGKTVGIIGCGNIGSDLIQLLAPFGCNLLINDIIKKTDFCRTHGAKQVDLKDLIAKSDIISLHIPLSSSTKKMVDNHFLRSMKPSAYLINTSRGAVIDQDILKIALKENTIAGAALDVFSSEPPKDKELLGLSNLVVTPHIGGNAKEAVQAMGRSAIDHLASFFKT